MTTTIEPSALSLTQLNQDLQAALTTQGIFDMHIRLHGKLIQFGHHPSGRVYGAITDGDYQIACMIPRKTLDASAFTPANDVAVNVTGKISLYAPETKIQLVVDTVSSESTPPASIDLPTLNGKIKAATAAVLKHPRVELSAKVVEAVAAPSGHFYCKLIANGHSIACMIPKPVVKGFKPYNGVMLRITGSLGLYDKHAKPQLVADGFEVLPRDEDSAAPAPTQKPKKQTGKPKPKPKPGPKHHAPDPRTSGAKFLAAVDELRAAGLWPREPRPIPADVQRIAVLTSAEGEAWPDFKAHYEKYGGTAKVGLVPVKVQGKNSPAEMVAALDKISARPDLKIDLIVLIRGGGAVKDLAAFDDIEVAKAICRCSIPVVTGIGHERDESIADWVADHRESTPTGAAIFLATGRSSTPQTSTNATSHTGGFLARLWAQLRQLLGMPSETGS